MLDMACNSANICSYGIKQHKPKQGKSHVSLPHFNEIWLQQNQLLQQNLLSYEQSSFNQGQPTSFPNSSSTSSPTLQYLLQQGKKKTEDRSVLNESQANPYSNTYNQYNSQYNNQITPYMSNQGISSVPIQPHYQPTPMTPSSAEQHLQYQQQNIYCENGQSYLPHNTYSNNYNSPPMSLTTITQNMRSLVARPLQEDNLYATQQYVAQQNYASNNSKQQNQTAANDQESSVVRPSQEVLQEDNLYAAQQYITQQNYASNNNKPQNQTAANNQESSVVRSSEKVLQEDNLYATQQYVTQQNYAGNNNEQQSHIAANNSKNKQQQVQHYAWMKFKHDPGSENKRARKRQTYTQQQTFRLEEVFYANRYLSKAERVKLSKQLNLSEQQIKIWFQNRRMKAKKEQQQLSVNEQHLRLNKTSTREQSISQQESVMHQQQSIVQQPTVQQWLATQQTQLHQTHQDYQNCPQQQYVFRCAP